MIYADHAATTAPLPEVVEAVARALADGWGNPSSVHAFGQRARRALEEARARVALALGAPDARQVVFTSGGTESVATAIAGAVPEPAGAHVVTSAIEHPCARAALDRLVARGAEVTVVAVDRSGRLDPAEVEQALRPQTRLCTIQWANHETGALQPVESIAAICRARGVPLHVDAVAALGKVDVAVEGIDLLSVAGHKAHGPAGIGALWIAPGLRGLEPLLPGAQERGRRAGTEPWPAAIGLGVACTHIRADGARWREKTRALQVVLEEGLVASGALVNAAGADRVPGLVNVAFPGVAADLLVVALDLAGVAVSAGAACSSGRPGPSPVLSALYPDDPARVAGSIRYSLGKDNEPEQIPEILRATAQAVERLRGAREAGRRAT